ncbi:MAG: hypothetical protein PHY73_08820 [Candidatus Omnitrophica bacterium]|nr:hypothetical protein [Candidatus Omnitrophota bacterium]
MLEEKTIDEVKHAKILSLNATCDAIPDSIDGTDLLIVRFNAESEDQLVFVGYMAGMAASAKVRFTVGVIITADEPDSVFSICYDTVICVSSEVEADQAVKTLIGDYVGDPLRRDRLFCIFRERLSSGKSCGDG